MVVYIIIIDRSHIANIATCVLCIIFVCITLHTAESGLEIINRNLSSRIRPCAKNQQRNGVDIS